ncbi:MAG: F0F1 ATP synthase subunit A [Clostridia bacterium]|nr:F0F1 ATP synthase subunit A [Clostridia bacterium]
MLSGKFADFLRNQYREAFSGGMSDKVSEALEPELVNLFGLKVNPSMFTAFGLTVFILLVCVIVRIFIIPKFQKRPKGMQIVLEGIVGYFDRSATSELHRHGSFVGPYVFTAAAFIALGTLVELIGIRPAFGSINACFAFGFTTFLVINICGIREKKLWGRAKRYVPNIINILTDISVPFSLSLRLFGSIMSGFIITELLYAQLFTSIVLPAFVAVITTLFHAAIQSYLFATLTVMFVREAVE